MTWIEFWGWLGALAVIVAGIVLVAWGYSRAAKDKGWHDDGEGE